MIKIEPYKRSKLEIQLVSIVMNIESTSLWIGLALLVHVNPDSK